MAQSALTTPVATGPGSWTRGLTYVPGFDGIRAIAVVAVLLFHAGIPGVPGGFLGVDIFFVLSGYLITSLLLQELDTRGDLRFGRFYAGRARRLLPALFGVLGLGALLCLTVARDAATQFVSHAVAAILYVANWSFVVAQESYFEAMGRPPMLQHLWSLALEEQFYLLWPLFCYLLYRRGGRTLVGGVALAGAVASSLLMAGIAIAADLPQSADASRVYFGTDTHCMGLLLGAALATVWRPGHLTAPLERAARFTLTAAGIVALGGIFAALHLVTEDSQWLYRGGFLVVAALTAAVVAVAAHPALRFGQVLGMQPLRYLGQRSYGIYLYHWPIFVVLRPELDVPFGDLPVTILRFALTLLVAEASYRWLELPIRRGVPLRIWRSWRERGLLVATALTAMLALVAGATATATAVAVNAVPAPSHDFLYGATSVGEDAAAQAERAVLMDRRAQRHGTPGPVTGPTGAAPAPGVTPAPPVDYSERAVSAYGDSVMLGARYGLAKKLGYVTVDAAVSRDWPGIQAQIDARTSYGSVTTPVVIHTGTNGPAELAGLQDMVKSLPDSPVIVFVTINTPNWWMDDSNRNIRKVAEQHPEQVRIADWEAASAGHGEYFVEDGTHLTPAGINAYAAVVLEALQGNPPPS